MYENIITQNVHEYWFCFSKKKLKKENHSRLLFRLKNLRVCNKHH